MTAFGQYLQPHGGKGEESGVKMVPDLPAVSAVADTGTSM